MTTLSGQDALICGSLAFDTIMVFEDRFRNHILPDKIHMLNVSFLVPQMRREFGGCAGNIAYNLQLLGDTGVPMATAGKDFAPYAEWMARNGVPADHIRVIESEHTAQAFITTDLDDNQIAAFHPGAMAFSADNDFSGRQAAWGIVAPDSKAGMFAHAERFRAMGVPFVFDLGQAMPLFDGDDLARMLDMAQVLTVNDYEAGVVEQRMGRSMADISRGMQAVVVTRGAQGSTLLVDGAEQHIPPVQPDAVVDPTGCGDAHRAGLLYARTLGWDWPDCCRLANLMGAIKIASRGPQNHAPTREQIAERLHAAYGLRLPA